jgi:hypothetical protein
MMDSIAWLFLMVSLGGWLYLIIRTPWGTIDTAREWRPTRTTGGSTRGSLGR